VFTAIDRHWPKAEHLAEFIDFLHLVQDETGHPDGMLESSVWRELGVGGPPSGRLLGFSRWASRDGFLAAVATIRSMAPWRKPEWDEHPDEVLMLEPAEPSQRLSERPSPDTGFIFHHLAPGRRDDVVRGMVERAELMAQAAGFLDAGPWQDGSGRLVGISRWESRDAYVAAAPPGFGSPSEEIHEGETRPRQVFHLGRVVLHSA
jgi:heme-degrading monooxygenase HmoA